MPVNDVGVVLFVLTTCNTLPVGKADAGYPVQFVNVPDAGVPKAGVTNVGLVASTTFPVPVELVQAISPRKNVDEDAVPEDAKLDALTDPAVLGMAFKTLDTKNDSTVTKIGRAHV